MAPSREPFGDCLFDGIPDLDQHIRNTIRAAIGGIDVRRHRAAAAATRITDYRGGPIAWAPGHMAEAA